MSWRWTGSDTRLDDKTTGEDRRKPTKGAATATAGAAAAAGGARSGGLGTTAMVEVVVVVGGRGRRTSVVEKTTDRGGKVGFRGQEQGQGQAGVVREGSQPQGGVVPPPVAIVGRILRGGGEAEGVEVAAAETGTLLVRAGGGVVEAWRLRRLPRFEQRRINGGRP